MMDDYIIPFYGLKEGEHEYTFVAENLFFEHFGNPEFPGGNLNVDLVLFKRHGFMELKFHITGGIKVYCDRCLELFEHPVGTENVLYVRFGEDFEELSDEIIILPFEESRLNIAQYIYEFVVLSLPVKKVHPPLPDGNPACNEEMIKKLSQHQARDEKKTDPRWDALKNLKNNN